jgi:transcription initiation factor IIE alpha subunit
METQTTLFDAALNRNDVYHAIEPALSEKRAQVLIAIMELGEATDEQISDKLHWTINRVTGRRHELQDLSLVEQVRTEKGPYGYPRSVWKVNTNQLNYFILQHSKEN